MPVDDWSADPAFQRAFVAVSYLAGAREPAALAPFDVVEPAARRLVQELAAAERPARAQALSRELSEIARALERSRLA